MAKGIPIFLILTISLFSASFAQKTDFSGDQFHLIWEKYASRETGQIPFDSLQIDLNQFLKETSQSENPKLETWLYPYYRLALKLYYYSPKQAANVLLPLSQYEWQSPIDSVYDRLGRIFNLMGVALKNSQRPGQGAEKLSQAIYYFKKTELKDPLILPSLFNNVANAYQNLGDFKKAAEYCEEGNRQIIQSIAQQKGNSQIIEALNGILIPIKINWGIILGKMRYYEQSISLYQEAQDLASEIDPSSLPTIYGNLGVSYQELGDFANARQSYQRSIQLAEDQQNTDLVFNSSVNLLSLYSQTKDLEDFAKLRSKLLSEINQQLSGDNAKRFIATICIQEAKIFLNTDRAQDAIASIEKAYELLSSKQVILSNRQFINNILNYPYLSLDLMHLASRSLVSSGLNSNLVAPLKQATLQLNMAEKVVDSLRSVLVSQESKIILNEQQKKIYRSKADLCQYLFDLEGDEKHLNDLFQTIERGKSAGLWNEMQQQDLKSAYLPDSLLQQEKYLKNELAQVLNNIKKQNERYDSDPKIINRLESRSFDLSGSLDSLYRIYNQRYPEFYKLKFDNETRSLRDIQKLMRTKEVFVQIFVTEKKVHELLIKKDTILYQALPNVDHLLELTQQLLDELKPRRYNYTRNEFSRFTEAAEYLYQSLFAGFSAEIVDCNLIISPDNLFSLFPFEVLVSASPPDSTFDFGDLNYLIYDHSINYTNTATLWAFHRGASQSEKPAGPVLAFAPYYEAGRGNLPFSAIYGEALPVLPGTLQEVKEIKKRFKGRFFIKQAATESRYKKLMKNASILHLAMHTIIDNDEPLNSYLVFYPDKKSKDDGRLSGSEILNYDINAQLVVLSACNSGSGTVRAGEGILSLSRSFIQAGSQSLLLNLWTMDDTQGKNLIISFYGYIAQGFSIAEALRKAKIDHLRSSRPLLAHPHYWAGLVTQGTDLYPVLPVKNHTNWIYLLLLIPLGALSWFLTKKLGSRRFGSQSIIL